MMATTTKRTEKRRVARFSPLCPSSRPSCSRLFCPPAPFRHVLAMIGDALKTCERLDSGWIALAGGELFVVILGRRRFFSTSAFSSSPHPLLLFPQPRNLPPPFHAASPPPSPAAPTPPRSRPPRPRTISRTSQRPRRPLPRSRRRGSRERRCAAATARRARR